MKFKYRAKFQGKDVPELGQDTSKTVMWNRIRKHTGRMQVSRDRLRQLGWKLKGHLVFTANDADTALGVATDVVGPKKMGLIGKIAGIFFR